MSSSGGWRSRLRDWLRGCDALLFLNEASHGLPDELRLAGYLPVPIDFGEIEDKAGLMEALRDALGLGPWFGANWDALNDALFGPDTPDAAKTVLVLQRPATGQRLPEADFDTLLEIITDVAASERSTLRGAVVVG